MTGFLFNFSSDVPTEQALVIFLKTIIEFFITSIAQLFCSEEQVVQYCVNKGRKTDRICSHEISRYLTVAQE